MELGWRCWEVFQSSGDGVVVTDQAGEIVFVNPRLLEMSGYAEAELLGQRVEMLVPVPSREAHHELKRTYHAEPYPRMMGEGPCLRMRVKDGSHLDVEIALAPMGAASGLRTVATIRDVTRRLVLETERTHLLDTLDLVPDLVIVGNAVTLRIEYVNRAVTEVLGYLEGELLGEPVSRIAPGDSDAQRKARIAELAAGDISLLSQFSLRSAAGELIPVELHRRVMVDPDGSRHVVAVARDIRSRIADEERLRASEKAFRTVFEAAPLGALVARLSTDGSRSIVMANQGLADMLGCTVPDFVGRDLTRFTLPEDHASDALELADLATGRRHRLSRLRRLRRTDGAVLWADVRARQFTLPDAPGPAVLSYWLDVTGPVEARARQDRQVALTACVAEVATATLADAPVEEVLNRIVHSARDLVGADASALALRTAAGILHVPAVAGELLAPLVHRDIPMTETTALRRVRAGETLLLPGPPAYVPAPWDKILGPVTVCPFGDEDQHPVGYLLAVRAPGEGEFSVEAADDLARLAEQTQLAVHLARARADQHRLALLEERQRIARDLHDGALQDVIALGMELAAEADRETDPRRRDRELRRLECLEDVVRQMRQTVFQLRAPDRRDLDVAIHDLVGEAARVLGHHPEVSVHGPPSDVPDDIAADVLAVLREALANVARHAQATRTRVALEVTAQAVTLTVDDDGVGVPHGQGEGYGIRNIIDRARDRHGATSVGPGVGGGTRLTWTCPLAGHLSR